MTLAFGLGNYVEGQAELHVPSLEYSPGALGASSRSLEKRRYRVPLEWKNIPKPESEGWKFFMMSLVPPTKDKIEKMDNQNEFFNVGLNGRMKLNVD